VAKYEFVRWLDNCFAQEEVGWSPKEDMVHRELCMITSVGKVIHEDQSSITLLPHADSDDSGYGAMIILKRCIVQRGRLRFAGEKAKGK
jgi:hypothetical protein